MKAVIQRVSSASVTIDGRVSGAIDKGLLILLGVARDDTEKGADLLAAKISKLRIFEDAAGKMNLSLLDNGGSALVVSQFTLLAGCRKGNRPSFDRAEEPARARQLYEHFVTRVKGHGVPVQTGGFGAYMDVKLVNDGPVTIILDSNELVK